MFVADALSRAYLTETDADTEFTNFLWQTPGVKAWDRKWHHNAGSKISKEVHNKLKPYCHVREELSIADKLIFKGERIVIPHKKWGGLLKRINEGHIGIEACKRRYRKILNALITDVVSKCPVCQKYKWQQQKEPLIPHEVPNRPWQSVSTDIFYFKGTDMCWLHILDSLKWLC